MPILEGLTPELAAGHTDWYGDGQDDVACPLCDIVALNEAVWALSRVSNVAGLAEVVAADLRHLRQVIDKIDRGEL